MSTEASATGFDRDEVAAALLGTWSFPDSDEPAGISFVHFTDTGRAIQFVFNPRRPEKRFPMLVWYSVESPTRLRFRLRADHEGWLRGYRFDGRTMTLDFESQSWICTRLSPDEMPEWLDQLLVSALAKP